MQRNNSREKTKKLVTLALFAAIAVVLMLLIRIPFPPAPFLEYDPADIPIFIVTFLFGPISGLTVTVIVSVIQALTVSSASHWIGAVMHILATGSFCIAAGLIYQRNRTRKGAIIALIVGSLVMTAVMCGCNLIFTPIFMGAPRETVIAMLLPVIIPFNLIKAGINSLVTFAIYKSISKLIHPKKDNSSLNKNQSVNRSSV